MAKHLPKISVVTPSFNSAKYIEDCIQSVLGQNYPNFEHIVIDGGSTDGTIDILKKYPHLKWISEPDEGQSDALNKGFKMATGEIIGWCNSDDYYLPGAFKKAINVFKSTNGDIVFADCIFVDKYMRFLRLKREIGFNYNLLFYYGCYIPTISCFFNINKIRKDDLELNIDLHNVMDYELFIKLSKKKYSFHYVDDIWGVYRLYPENKTLSLAAQRKRERYYVQKKYAKIVFKNEMINKAYFELMRIIYKTYHILVKIIKGRFIENV